MDKLHLIKTPFQCKRTNLSENCKSKKYQAANSSTTYIGQNVDPLHDISVSDTNETLSDCTFGSDTTFGESIENALQMSSISEDNTLDILSPSNCKIPSTSSAIYLHFPEHIHQNIEYSLESREQQPISLSQTSFSSDNSNQSACPPSITTVIKKKNKSTMCRTDGMCFIKNKDVQKLVLNPQFEGFISALKEAQQFDSFVNLVNAISSGALPTSNLAWKSSLYRGACAMCKSTVGIRFDTEFNGFFAILQLLFSNSCLNVLQGPCHFGHVVTEKSTRGLYDPSTSQCNFVIPSRSTLQKIDIGYPKEVPPGFINHTVEVASGLSDKGEQFVCSFDGKTLAIGSKGETMGDINMWGVEPKSMNIHHNLECRNTLLSFLDQTTAQLTQVNLPHRQKEL